MLTIHVLNLLRRPDRRDAFLRSCPQEGLRVNFVDAIDGRTLNHPELVNAGVLVQRYKHFTAGDVGCACSHKMMWERCVAEEQPLVVCEDDAVLRADFSTACERVLEQVPSDWDYVALGYNLDVAIDVDFVPHLNLYGTFSKSAMTQDDLTAFARDKRPTTVLPLNNVFGTCAYAVSPKGAQQLLQLCFPMAGLAAAVPAMRQIIWPTGTIDAIMNVHYRKLQAFCVLPPLAVTANEHQTSDARNPAPLK